MKSRGKDHTGLLAVATILLCLVFVLLIMVHGTYSGGADPFIIQAKSGGHHKHQSSINNETSSSSPPSSPSSSNQQSKVTNNVKNTNKQGTAGPLTTTTTAGSPSNSTTTTNYDWYERPTIINPIVIAAIFISRESSLVIVNG